MIKQFTIVYFIYQFVNAFLRIGNIFLPFFRFCAYITAFSDFLGENLPCTQNNRRAFLRKETHGGVA